MILRDSLSVAAIASIAAIALATGAFAQGAEFDVPDFEELAALATEFDGSLTTPQPIVGGFDMRLGATFEGWFAATWLQDLDDDPCLFSLLNEGEVVLSVRLDGAREYVGLQSGDDYLAYVAAFSADTLNHIAVVTMGDRWEVILNGAGSDLIPFATPPGPVDSMHLGGCGLDGPGMIGWITNARVWNYPLNLAEIDAYLPVTDNIAEEDHPFLPLLRGLSLRSGSGGLLFAVDGLTSP